MIWNPKPADDGHNRPAYTTLADRVRQALTDAGARECAEQPKPAWDHEAGFTLVGWPEGVVVGYYHPEARWLSQGLGPTATLPGLLDEHNAVVAGYWQALVERGYLVGPWKDGGGWPGLWVQEAASVPVAVPAAPRLPRKAPDDTFPHVPSLPQDGPPAYTSESAVWSAIM